MTRIWFSWRLCMLFGLVLGTAVGPVLLLQSCEQRACKVFQREEDGGTKKEVLDNSSCRGYACNSETLLCRTSCKTDEQCDDGSSVNVGGFGGLGGFGGTGTNTDPKVRHYVCRSGKCVCNDADTAAAKALNCHRKCELNEDCNSLQDPNTKEVLSVEKGYTCAKAEGQSGRFCSCTNPARGCKVPTEPKEEFSGGGFEFGPTEFGPMEFGPTEFPPLPDGGTGFPDTGASDTTASGG